jgi:(1->4)-alpha-D-glucan 1-alpha-D-glucosylmutase
MAAVRIPTATYRIQFTLNFRFSDARELVPYLNELGISDLYASPRFKARKGSSHGYDIADPQRINSELGTEREFDEFALKLKHYSMGMLLDIVPNHMAATHENPWWKDVLENGPSSEFADFFDIDWHPATTKAAFLQENKVLLPVLGDLYGNVLENLELVLKLDESGFHIRYCEHKFPLDPKSCRSLVEQILEILKSSPETESEVLVELVAVLQEIDRMPVASCLSPEDKGLRRTCARTIKDRLWRLYVSNAEVRKAVEDVMRQWNGKEKDPESVNQLDQLLSVQSYRLAHWKIGLEEINYRRFFDINDLVGLRVENPRVFEARHRLIFSLIRDGKVTGLRVDHIDGLYDPLGYLQQLQQGASFGVSQPDGKNIYVVVEKILGERESLPEDWPVFGTTGYDFLNALNAIFIDPEGLSALERSYARFTGKTVPFASVSYAGNKLCMDQLFAGEIHLLTHRLASLAAQDRHARDLPLYELVQLLIEVTACLPVYRTYMREGTISPRDRVFIERALQLARERTPAPNVSDAALGFLRQVLFLEPPAYAQSQRERYLSFAMHWQQFTGPVMAKGLEDTASYVHNSLISLNEVGEDPLRESLPLEVEALHLFNQERQENWPHTLNATSTHDTKRGEDVRARINVLSEIPTEWEAALVRWSRWNQSRKKTVGDHLVPAPEEEMLLYQTLLGAWPLQDGQVPEFKNRVKDFVVKAARETKIFTNWIDPNPDHEAALQGFVEAIFQVEGRNRFLTDLTRFHKKISFYGALNSLSQVLLKIASPGVPDFYQGEELWDFNLVDPDNRSPVDFALRARFLDELKAAEQSDTATLLADVMANWQDGRIKLYLTWKAARFRHAERELFAEGTYMPLVAIGKARANVCAFARKTPKQWALSIAPRFFTRLVDPGQPPLGHLVWGSTGVLLPRGAPLTWKNVFTGQQVRATRTAGRVSRLPLASMLEVFPVALLHAKVEESAPAARDNAT